MLCVAVRNRKGGDLCVGVRGRVPEWLHQGGAREEGGRHGARGGVSTQRVRAIVHRRSHLPLSLCQGGSGPSKKVGRPLGVYFLR